MSEEQISIPPQEYLPDEPTVWRWYLNIEPELARLALSEEEVRYVSDYYRGAGLLRVSRRSFFRRHYARTVAEAVGYLFAHKRRPVILDLGCGTGTQTLLFALLGAHVLSLDMDGVALGILAKRKAFYEQLSGRKLAIDVQNANSLEYDYRAPQGIDGVFSMFAFNMMQPSGRLMDRILEGCSSDVRLCILDGNNRSWYARAVPSRRRNVWSPLEFEKEVRQRGFAIHRHRGAVSVPPIFWSVVPARILGLMDDVLNRTWLMPVSHLIMAARER